jgi:hypothetical protein
MSWFSKFVGDPLKALLAKVIADGTSDLKALAGDVAAQLPAAPVSATVETAFQTAVQTAVDGYLTAAVGTVPVIGSELSADAVTEANEAIDYMVEVGGKAINSLAASAKATLAAVAKASPTAGVAAGAVGAS